MTSRAPGALRWKVAAFERIVDLILWSSDNLAIRQSLAALDADREMVHKARGVTIGRL
jgi:hypothetical protein